MWVADFTRHRSCSGNVVVVSGSSAQRARSRRSSCADANAFAAAGSVRALRARRFAPAAVLTRPAITVASFGVWVVVRRAIMRLQPLGQRGEETGVHRRRVIVGWLYAVEEEV